MPQASPPVASAEAAAADDLFEQPAIGATESTAEPAAPRSGARTSHSASWFAAHGKYIAIAFVIALIGTIYFASTSGRGGPPIADHNHSHPGEASLRITVPASSQATVVGEARPDDGEAKVGGDVQEASPAQLATESRPQTDLHPPTIPQLEAPVVAEAAAHTPADPSLFPWVKADERVATRPESTAADASTLPAAPGQVQPAQPQTQPQAAQPQYPTTSQPTPNLAPQYPPAQYPSTQYPAVQYPTTSPAQPAYPATNTPNQYTFPPGPAGAPPANGPALNGPALAPPAGGSQFFPPDNSARGSRYERTGSGLY